nr:hypothetical protein [Tanacetum cinerariifolium]
MDLLAFIRTVNPTKVRVAKRQRAKDEPRVLESTVGRVVPLLPIARAHASSELKASVGRLFDEGASGDGQDADVQPVALMVPIQHSPDQRVVGASALTYSLEVSNSRVKNMRENTANHVSALCGVFVPLSELLSATTLKGMEGTSGSTPDAAATLSMTLVSASTIPPISTDDYEGR